MWVHFKDIKPGKIYILFGTHTYIHNINWTNIKATSKRSLMGYSPQGHKELGMTKVT